jgi:hypothetical protein
MTEILTTAVAFALGDLLNDVTHKSHIRWMDADGVIRTGELRSIVRGPNNFASMPYGMDVRDAYVWITGSGVECTESIAHLVNMIQQGGYVKIV